MQTYLIILPLTNVFVIVPLKEFGGNEVLGKKVQLTKHVDRLDIFSPDFYDATSDIILKLITN